MKAIIVFESLYGNTRKIAEYIAEGLQKEGVAHCEVVKTSEVKHTDDIADFQIIGFGCPNHNQEPAMNMVKFIERAKIVHPKSAIGFVFDTYTGGNRGIAMKKMEKLVAEKMPELSLKEGFSAKVEGRKGPLASGEAEKAREYGQKLAHL